jgi:LPXTG-motif cell wall-anchored protein
VPRSLRAVAIGAVLAVAATPFLALTTATAAPGQSILMFSNPANTDVDEEDLETLASLTATGATVTVFDGGDGSAAAWQTALTGIDVLVFPEFEGVEPYGPATAAISDEAAVAISTWNAAQHVVVFLGAYDSIGFLSYLSGIDYTTSMFDTTPPSGEWQLVAPDYAGPAILPSANYAGGATPVTEWTAEQQAAVTPIYLDESGDVLGIGRWTNGSGWIYYVAYDWYPDEGDILSGVRAAWDAALASVVAEVPAAPVVIAPVVTPAATLPNTGAEEVPAQLLSAAVLLLAGATLLVIRRRAVRA